MTTSYTFRAELWHYPEEAGWHFITLPPELTEELKDQAAPFRKSFGSVKVSACIAAQRWQTSLFPDSRTNSYLLPVKKAIRTAADIRAGDEVDVEIDLIFEG